MRHSFILVSKKVFFRTSKARLSEKLGFSGTANQGFACFVGCGIMMILLLSHHSLMIEEVFFLWCISLDARTRVNTPTPPIKTANTIRVT